MSLGILKCRWTRSSFCLTDFSWLSVCCEWVVLIIGVHGETMCCLKLWWHVQTRNWRTNPTVERSGTIGGHSSNSTKTNLCLLIILLWGWWWELRWRRSLRTMMMTETMFTLVQDIRSIGISFTTEYDSMQCVPCRKHTRTTPAGQFSHAQNLHWEISHARANNYLQAPVSLSKAFLNACCFCPEPCPNHPIMVYYCRKKIPCYNLYPYV